MKILAIDASGGPVSAAIADESKIIGEYTLNFKMTHSQTLMPAIDKIIKDVGFDIKELDYIACTSGPGSFTGLRIGAATAKGLAHGLGIKIVPVPTLTALAYNIFETDKVICPIMDARRRQVYNAFYMWNESGLEELVPQEPRSIEEVIEIAESFEMPVILTPQLAEAKEKSCITLNNSNFSGLTGKGVIMGIIDSGITYDHREFENRVIYIWDIPNDRVYNEEEIRDGIDFTDSIGHGTAVAGIAAGTGGVAPGAEIISVAIGRGSSDDIMRGVKFIADRANERNMPFVINISYGTNFGAHDGQSLFEQYIDSVAEKNVASIVIASGNEGDKYHHYRGQGSRTVEFNVGRSLESVRLELYKNYLYNASYEIISPDGSTTGVMSGNDSLYNQILQNTDIVVNIIIPTPYTVDERVVIELTGIGFVDSGIWQLRINTADESVFDIWLPVSEGVTEDTVFLAFAKYTSICIA